MGALAKGMHASVGPARPVDADLTAGNLEKGRFQPVLNGVASHLTLPAGEAGAIVSDD